MNQNSSRRQILTQGAALLGATSSGLLVPQSALAQSGKIRVGLMLPYTGTFAQLGVAIENGVRMAINEQGGKLGGREIEWFKVDDESEPSKAIENANKLVQRDKVDVLIGTVHSGVQMGIHRVARESGVINLIPNAGVHIATRAQCAPNVFRASFSNSQPTMALGEAMVKRGQKRRFGSPGNTLQGTKPSRASKKATPKRAAPSSRHWACPSPTSSSKRCSPKSPRSSPTLWLASLQVVVRPSSCATMPLRASRARFRCTARAS